MRTFSSPPMATSASFAPFSIPATKADMATKLDTPRMIPSMVSSERNLCAQISRNPAMTVVLSWAEEWRTRSVGGLRSCDFMGNTKHQKPKTRSEERRVGKEYNKRKEPEQ